MKTLKNILTATLTVLVLSGNLFAGNGTGANTKDTSSTEVSNAAKVETCIVDDILSEVEIQIVDSNFKNLVTRKFKSVKEAKADKEMAALIKSSDLVIENNNTFIYLKN
jgi:hypothetical protein